MLFSRLQRCAAVGLLALAITGSATEAFAIRNRYTNEQNEGFAALFVEAFGHPGWGDDQPVGRFERRPLAERSRHRDDGEAPPFAD